MNDEQLLRYSRQILLPQLGFEGQQKISQAHVLVIGLGGLGSPVAMYLTAAGIGRLTLVDFDRVDLSNLQRQIVHRDAAIGTAKVESAATTLAQLNPHTDLHCIDKKLDEKELQQVVSEVDVVVDASDNFDTRFAINRACVLHRKPLVSGAAIRMEGQVSVFDMRDPLSPCYRCLYDEQGAVADTCSENGVLAPIVGIIGSIQAMETLKIIAEIGDTLQGRLLMTDGLHQEWRNMKLRKDPACPVCSKP